MSGRMMTRKRRRLQWLGRPRWCTSRGQGYINQVGMQQGQGDSEIPSPMYTLHRGSCSYPLWTAEAVIDINTPHQKKKTPLSTEKHPTSLPINAPLPSARIRPETQHLPTHETRCGTGSTAGHLHPAPPTWRLMRQNSRRLAHRGGGPSPRRPSADRAVPCSERLRVKPTELSVRWMGRRCCLRKFDLILGSLINGRFFVCLSALLMGVRCHLIEVSKLKYRRLEQVRSREFAGTGQSCHSCGGIISISQSPVPSPASVTSFLPALTSVIIVQVVHPVLLLLCPTSVVSGRPPPHYRDAMSPENVKHECKTK